MSNQRKGKYQTKDTSHNDMKFFKCLKMAAKVLDDAGHEEPAFYFDQLVDHISSGKHLPLNEEQMTRALGV